MVQKIRYKLPLSFICNWFLLHDAKQVNVRFGFEWKNVEVLLKWACKNDDGILRDYNELMRKLLCEHQGNIREKKQRNPKSPFWLMCTYQVSSHILPSIVWYWNNLSFRSNLFSSCAWIFSWCHVIVNVMYRDWWVRARIYFIKHRPKN